MVRKCGLHYNNEVYQKMDAFEALLWDYSGNEQGSQNCRIVERKHRETTYLKILTLHIEIKQK